LGGKKPEIDTDRALAFELIVAARIRGYFFRPS